MKLKTIAVLISLIPLYAFSQVGGGGGGLSAKSENSICETRGFVTIIDYDEVGEMSNPVRLCIDTEREVTNLMRTACVQGRTRSVSVFVDQRLKLSGKWICSAAGVWQQAIVK